ncbi:sugar porter family MFS transporter [Pantoea sp. Al-1710]|uniref:Sugar porter family MFS transporter n=1 Tax=Candidatus Pantoea communis TaxID=2608354 RepID=A0ABX0RP26_9GAMM|nr:sugar porter family MFS transporter [Pantoea communis]NIG19336.1 sugar porter family MFS transporter [Pantoea communis]
MNKVNLRLALIASIGGLLFGYETAVIAGAIKHLTTYFSLTSAEVGWAVSSALAGCMVGAVAGGFVINKFGRKKALIVAALFILISAIGTALPPNFTMFWMFRIVGGLGVGLASLTVPVYISEISAHEVRGRMTGIYQLMIAGGIMVVYIVNTVIALSNTDPVWALDSSWRWMFASMGIPAAFFFIALFTIPETPHWLIRNNRIEEAREVIARVHGGNNETLNVVSGIISSFSQNGKRKKSVNILSKENRFLTMIVFGTAVLVNSTGINAVLYYGNVLLESIGLASGENAFWQQIAIGVMLFSSTFIALRYVEQSGRRKLLLIGTAGCGASICLLGVLIYLHMTSLWMLVLILAYIVFFSAFVGPIFWIMLPEMAPNHLRDRLVSAAVLIVWVSNFMVAQTFPMMNDSPVLRQLFNGSFPFFIYAVFCGLYFLLTLKYLPETRNRTLEEISLELTSGKKQAAKEAITD